MGRKERLKGALIACSSTLVMIIAGWLLWIRVDVAAENQRESILTTTGRLAAYEQLYDQAQHERAASTSHANTEGTRAGDYKCRDSGSDTSERVQNHPDELQAFVKTG